MAYFRACITIFDLMEKEIYKLTDISGFLVLVEDFISNFTNYAIFKQLMEQTYINKDLLSKVRESLIIKEQARYEKMAGESDPAEVCNENTPYCFTNNRKIFIDNNNITLMSESITDNLKINYFNYLDGNKLMKQPRNSIKQFNIEPTDKLNGPFLSNSDFATHNFSSKKEIENESNNDKGKDIICLRQDHVKKCLIYKENGFSLQKRQKEFFFEKNKQLFNEYLGPIVLSSLLSKKKRKTKRLNDVKFEELSRKYGDNSYRLKRTSLEIKKKQNFKSVDAKNKRIGGRKKTHLPFNLFKKKEKLVKGHRKTSKGDNQIFIEISDHDDSEDSDEEFFRNLDKKYKNSIYQFLS